MIIITGPGRSGTSVLARLYLELGFNPGGKWHEDKRAGLERGAFWRLNNQLALAAGFTIMHPRKKASPNRSRVRMINWDRVDSVVDEYGDQMRELARTTSVVKDPRFEFTLPLWVQAGAQIDYVVITVRTMKDMVASRHAAGQTEFNAVELRNALSYGLGVITATVHEHSIPHRYIRFPDFIHDLPMLHSALVFPEPVDYQRFAEVASRVFDPTQVHDWSAAAKADI